jgi:antitoxin (DNA-binding transcriptional repressor) of toxin-antitoxin stability system
MKTITVTEAKRSLGQYLKQAAAGEEIGIVSGADIISLRKIEVVPADRPAGSAPRKAGPADNWPEFPTFDGGPADGAIHHDKYLYDEPNRIGRKKSRK